VVVALATRPLAACALRVNIVGFAMSAVMSAIVNTGHCRGDSSLRRQFPILASLVLLSYPGLSRQPLLSGLSRRCVDKCDIRVELLGSYFGLPKPIAQCFERGNFVVHLDCQGPGPPAEPPG
jgi:hypothetical protein